MKKIKRSRKEANTIEENWLTLYLKKHGKRAQELSSSIDRKLVHCIFNEANF